MVNLRSKFSRPAAWLCALFAAWAWLPLQADMYRWVDEHGGTVYSESPPPSGQAVELEPPPPPPPGEVRAAEAREKSAIERAFDAQEDRKRAAQDKAKQEAAAEQRTTSCAAARQNLETLQNLGARPVRMPNGQSHHLSEQEKAAKIHEAREQIAKYCP
jgi:hypothetical protein